MVIKLHKTTSSSSSMILTLFINAVVDYTTQPSVPKMLTTIPSRVSTRLPPVAAFIGTCLQSYAVTRQTNKRTRPCRSWQIRISRIGAVLSDGSVESGLGFTFVLFFESPPFCSVSEQDGTDFFVVG